MGKISSGVTWSIRTYAGAWDDCYDEPLIRLIATVARLYHEVLLDLSSPVYVKYSMQYSFVEACVSP